MGKTAVCTKCRQAFRIGESRPAFEWKPTDLGEDSWIGVAPPEEKKEIRHCIICDAALGDDAVRCPACGANQVTGVVRRPRREPAGSGKSVLLVIPVRLIVIAVVLALVGAGVYRGIRALSESAAKTGEQLVHQALAGRAAAHLREGGDAYTFADQFTGQVSDENLVDFVTMLSAGDPDIRRAATLLIGCGNVTQLEPILALAHARDSAPRALAVLEAIGPRRLVQLSGHADAQVRQSAATALCLLFNLEREDETVNSLAEAVPFAQKVRALNGLCRPWPQAVGPFIVIIDETKSDFLVDIEQIGRTFYLRAGSIQFRSSSSEQRTFRIPIERWCAATGPAVDVAAARRLLGGSITLVSPVGASWEGTVRVIAKRRLTGRLPGFLPIDPPTTAAAIEAPIRLERPGF